MELVNQTPLAASCFVTDDTRTEGAPRMGMITAKATFHVDPQTGATQIDDQEPFPLLQEPMPTELGSLPSDAVPRRDPAFEVIVLGAAYAPGGRPTKEMNVELRVGPVHRVLRVIGDRVWVTSLRTPVLTPPAAFVRMPLTYDRAFGGKCPTHIDLKTIIDVQDDLNPYGRGFDAAFKAKYIAEGFGAPEGFPHLGDYQRTLPNLENPAHLIQRWDDAPEPYCWSTVPQDIGFAQIRTLRLAQQLAQAGEDEPPVEPAPDLEAMLFHRAHPDWIVELPPPHSRVTLTGFSPRGPLSFELPQLRVIADYTLGERRGARELAPHMLVLLPEQSKFYLVYRSAFTVDTEPSLERSFRLRTDRGWFEYPPSESN